jgi:hypothetical protein
LKMTTRSVESFNRGEPAASAAPAAVNGIKLDNNETAATTNHRRGMGAPS